MYAVILDYIRPLDEIDAALADHVAWLDAQYDAGIFLASGRREPRVGGLATHTVYEFHPSKWADEVGDQLRELMS